MGMVNVNSTSSKYEFYCPLCTKILNKGADKCPECGNPPPSNGWSSLSKCSFPLLGMRIEGHFIFDRFLGSGASGDVYRAVSAVIPRTFAVKVFDGSRYSKKELNQELLDRFSREIEVMAELENPHAVSIYNVIEINQSSYAYFMDFAPGTTLQQLLDRIERLRLIDALRVVRQVASALADLHTLKLIHCDVKPDNIIVQRFIPNDYFARLVDFGLVRSIGKDNLPYEGFRGSPLYASPEQCTVSKDIDQRSDIYALGCVLYACLTGHPPFEGTSDFAVIQAQVNEPVPSLREQAKHIYISNRLENLTTSMLAKNRDERPKTMAEVINIIDRIIIFDVQKSIEKTEGLNSRSDSPSDVQMPNEGVVFPTNIFGSQRLVQALVEYPIPPAIDKSARKFSAVSFYARTRAILADHNNIIHDVSLYQGTPVRSSQCEDSTITAVTFLNEEDAIVSVDLMRNVWCWRPQVGNQLRRITVLDERAYAISGACDKNEMLIGKENGDLDVLNIVTGKIETIHKGHTMVASIAMAVPSRSRVTPCTSIMIGYWDNSIQLLDVAQREVKTLPSAPAPPIALALSRDGRVGAVLTQERTIRIYDIRNSNNYFDIRNHEANISKIVFGPNSELLGISVDQTTIRIWDINIKAITLQFQDS